ncbi:MAG: tripartite tricarboxylate transporter substrate binding protein, partial [Betaproteobacteria bacterium]|nr:tripartite tricarboxylate transporter substrate binding protein [Betaproteobacteria bacterium]
PRGTPPAVIAAVSAALEKVARNREFVEQMNKLLLGVHYLGSQNFARFFAGEDDVFQALIEKLGLHVAPRTTR